MRLSAGLLIMAFGLAAPGVGSAEEVYKSTMPDGAVVYGESPQAGAKKVEKIVAPANRTGTVVVTPQDRARADALANRSSGPAVGVIPQAPRAPAPPLEAGTINPPGMMPKRSY